MTGPDRSSHTLRSARGSKLASAMLVVTLLLLSPIIAEVLIVVLPLDVIGKLVLNVIAVLLLILLARVISKRTAI